MHKSSKLRMQWFLNSYGIYIRDNSKGQDIKLLDIGGVDINGSYKDIMPLDFQRDVLDIAPGKDVNIVPKDPYSWEEINDNVYDVVISGNTFQHIKFFWKTISEVKRVLKPGGFFCMIAPSNRYEEKYPVACWAFNSDGLHAIAESVGFIVNDISVAGCPSKSREEDWIHPVDDAMLIAQKPGGIEIQNAPILKYEYRYDPFDEIFVNKMLKIQDLGITRIAICPFGRYGKRLKDIIDLNFANISYILVDNILSQTDTDICTIEELENKEDYRNVAFCLRNYRKSDLYHELEKNFSGRIFNFFE